MTEQDKKLLLVDLCARLPYYTFVEWDDGYAWLSIDRFRDIITNKFGNEWKRPYLRPMSSMTEEERVEMREFCDSKPRLIYDIGVAGQIHSPNVIDFLNSHHFDYRGLIEKGLALEAPADMYNNKDSERYENTL